MISGVKKYNNFRYSSIEWLLTALVIDNEEAFSQKKTFHGMTPLFGKCPTHDEHAGMKHNKRCYSWFCNLFQLFCETVAKSFLEEGFCLFMLLFFLWKVWSLERAVLARYSNGQVTCYFVFICLKGLVRGGNSTWMVIQWKRGKVTQTMCVLLFLQYFRGLGYGARRYSWRTNFNKCPELRFLAYKLGFVGHLLEVHVIIWKVWALEPGEILGEHIWTSVLQYSFGNIRNGFAGHLLEIPVRTDLKGLGSGAGRCTWRI